jgi:hypothetical protein
MRAQTVLVVGETPSLGRSVFDLLESGSVPCRFVHDVVAESPLFNLAERFPIVVTACNDAFCSAGRRFVRGELPGVTMVIVGSRDPALQSGSTAQLHVVSLPLIPSRLMSLVSALHAQVPPGLDDDRHRATDPGPLAGPVRPEARGIADPAAEPQ